MRAARLLTLTLALAACADERTDPLAPPPETAAPAPPAETAETAALPPDAAEAPHVYMALQPDPSGPTSVIVAIDQSRDGTPSDDPAIRLTPEGGQCNPQQLRYYDFPPDRAARPVYGPDDAAGGVTARELPDFLAVAVTAAMLERGLIAEPDESQPQNVCTRKLLQRMIIDQSTGQG